MKKNIVKNQVFKSFEEYKKKYFPKNQKDSFFEKNYDPVILGTKLADESLRLIKSLLSKP